MWPPAVPPLCSDHWKQQHGGQYTPQRSLCAAAGLAWRKLAPEQRAPFERLSGGVWVGCGWGVGGVGGGRRQPCDPGTCSDPSDSAVAVMVLPQY